MKQQLLRFVLAGSFVTGISTATYLIAVILFGGMPMLASIQAYLVAVLIGYRIHSHWTFRCSSNVLAGTKVNARFALASLSSLLMNGGWTWLLTEVVKAPIWTPALPMVFVTPAASFLINRHWVFRA